MSLQINIDKAVECVKTIFYNSQCAICDKAEGARMRYPCGHTACDDCVTVTEECLTCLTPLYGPAGAPVLDNVLTNRVENATSLFKACQEAFKIDVLRRKRVSEQLKLEKELFPECIQAPQKYGNKRKSLNTSHKNKENKSACFPGEDISLHRKMENTVDYVHQWLNKSGKNLIRKPFRDLNSEDPRWHNKSPLQDPLKLKISKNNENTNRKRTFKTDNSVLKQQNVLENFVITATKAKNKKRKINELPKQTKEDVIKVSEEKVQNFTNDESGIVIDDATIVIDDSQITIDKDRDALLAVLEADKNLHDSNAILSLDSKEMENSEVQRVIAKTKEYQVPFIKKGDLRELCPYCSNNVQYKADANTSNNPPNEISITIDNKSFTTVIKVCQVEQTNAKKFGKHSMAIQTEITESARLDHFKKTSIFDNIKCDQKPMKQNSLLAAMSSQDLFTDEAKQPRDSVYLKNINKSGISGNKTIDSTQGITIEESDSDDEADVGGLMEVTADIHRSCDQIDYGVLDIIDNFEEHEHRARRPARGLTPDSSNSSEKENFNPNRQKRIKNGKKYVCKKI